jgi:hypothetical protein
MILLKSFVDFFRQMAAFVTLFSHFLSLTKSAKNLCSRSCLKLDQTERLTTALSDGVKPGSVQLRFEPIFFIIA